VEVCRLPAVDRARLNLVVRTDRQYGSLGVLPIEVSEPHRVSAVGVSRPSFQNRHYILTVIEFETGWVGIALGAATNGYGKEQHQSAWPREPSQGFQHKASAYSLGSIVECANENVK